jgi:DNA-binding transcriptional MerR regulator
VDTIGPSEFGRITGLSSKAVRLYEERGLLSPSSRDLDLGYRRYTEADVARAGRIALLRRAGITLSEIGRFLADPRLPTIEAWLAAIDSERHERRNALAALANALEFGEPTHEEDVMVVIIRSVESLDELNNVFEAAGAQFEPPIDRSDEQRFGDLRVAFEAGERDLLLVAESDGTFAGAALGFKGQPSATLRILAVHSDYRRRGLGRSLLRAFEGAVERAGGESVALGGWCFSPRGAAGFF